MNYRCQDLRTHSLENLHPKTRCNWCKKTVKEITEFNKKNILEIKNE